MHPFDETVPLRERGLACARAVADWICRNQHPVGDRDADAGNYVFNISPEGVRYGANNWNCAFAIMGLLSAARVFGDERYRDAALDMGRYLATLQIFSPFLPLHYGAIREMTPQTPWCYTRDALSAAWAFLELGDSENLPEYRERARLWAEWFLLRGMDEEGWPLWGIQFEPYLKGIAPQMSNELQGCFQGGGLNFFTRLAASTGNARWCGAFYENIADRFCRDFQRPDGVFHSIERATKAPPASDPQFGLHRANDDLGTLGLLGAYRRLGKENYLLAVKRFLDGVFARQRPDGHFEDSCAAIPVVLNAWYEADGMVAPEIAPGAVTRALEALFARQYHDHCHPSQIGSFDENRNGWSCSRSAAYALIVLLKIFGGDRRFLRAAG